MFWLVRIDDCTCDNFQDAVARLQFVICTCTCRAVQDAASKRRHTTDVCVTNPNNEGPSPSNTHRVSSSPLLQRRRATFSPPAHTPAAAFPASTPNLVGHGIVSLLDARMAENQLSLIREEENEALAIMLGAQQAARWVTDADIDRVNLAFDAFKQAVKKTHTATKNFLAVATAALEHSQSGIALAQADAGDVSNARVAELREILARATHMMDVMVRFMANGSKTPYYVPQPPPVWE